MLSMKDSGEVLNNLKNLAVFFMYLQLPNPSETKPIIDEGLRLHLIQQVQIFWDKDSGPPFLVSYYSYHYTYILQYIPSIYPCSSLLYSCSQVIFLQTLMTKSYEACNVPSKHSKLLKAQSFISVACTLLWENKNIVRCPLSILLKCFIISTTVLGSCI